MVAKGLCAKHYQQSRRPPPGKRGPKPKYRERDPGNGAPKVSIRLDPDLRSWVQKHGGSPWLRALILEAQENEANPGRISLRLPPDVLAWLQSRPEGADAAVEAALRATMGGAPPDRTTFVRHVEKVVIGCIKDAKASHQGELLPGSVAKRVATQLWADLGQSDLPKAAELRPAGAEVPASGAPPAGDQVEEA